MPEALCQRSGIHEVLWNFGRFPDERRLTLRQNPHFYKFSDLPMSQRAYVGKFEIDPIYGFHDSTHSKICVLTDNPGRVFLNTGRITRALGNFWKPSEAIIFKGPQIWGTFSHLFNSRHPCRRLWKSRGRKSRSRIHSGCTQCVVSGQTPAVAKSSARGAAESYQPIIYHHSIRNRICSIWPVR